MDTEKITHRIAEIIKHYELSAASFADSIHVQRSSISHLLKGRNKPSLEFVSKLAQTYPEVDLYWLLYGKGNFPTTTKEPQKKEATTKVTDRVVSKTKEKLVEKVMIFYKDGSFASYNPEQ